MPKTPRNMINCTHDTTLEPKPCHTQKSPPAGGPSAKQRRRPQTSPQSHAASRTTIPQRARQNRQASRNSSPPRQSSGTRNTSDLKTTRCIPCALRLSKHSAFQTSPRHIPSNTRTRDATPPQRASVSSQNVQTTRQDQTSTPKQSQAKTKTTQLSRSQHSRHLPHATVNYRTIPSMNSLNSSNVVIYQRKYPDYGESKMMRCGRGIMPTIKTSHGFKPL